MAILSLLAQLVLENSSHNERIVRFGTSQKLQNEYVDGQLVVAQYHRSSPRLRK